MKSRTKKQLIKEINTVLEGLPQKSIESVLTCICALRDQRIQPWEIMRAAQGETYRDAIAGDPFDD